MGVEKMKLTKKDIGWVQESTIMNEKGYNVDVPIIELDKLREVVEDLCSRRQGDEHGFGWVKERDICEAFGEVLEGEVKK